MTTKNNKLLAIKAAIYDMGLKFNQEPSDAKITAYAKELMDYSPAQINFAFREIINSGSAFFPSLAEVLKHLRPVQETVQDKAPQVAQEILQLLRWYGPHAEREMIENASEDARLVFLAIGYTGDIRNSENYETTKAQIERLARGVLSSKTAAQKNEQLERIGIDTSKVLTMKKPEFRTADFSGFLPTGPEIA